MHVVMEEYSEARLPNVGKPQVGKESYTTAAWVLP